ncbi:hypothetical protein BpHYR1_047807 [Brachionus plicatilis]|uniref:Uncharacterized protein n=1 Tax=Brachionus plicatilis TaxID=10195 RepID=A0A3M7QSX7_BRAPC|nr:hypothetical protein BpHYR1_047807 [Brachionus plicatilis]
MFGRKINGFRDWSSVDSELKHNALDERVLEIKFLMEKSYPEALRNIEKGKNKQVKAQNKIRSITEEKIPIGTKVWISIKGIQNKLHPKYRGPFTIPFHGSD